MKRTFNKKGYLIIGLLLLSCLIALKWYLASEEQLQKDLLKQYPQESNIPKSINLYNIPSSFVVRKIFHKNQEVAQVVFIKKRKKIAQQIYYKNRLIKQQGNIPNGIVREYDTKGILKAQYLYRNGKREGKAIRFDAQSYSVAYYHQDQLNGSFRIFNGNGVLLVEKKYEKNIQKGPIKLYDPQNKSWSEIAYENGQLGSWIQYYSKNKNLLQITNLKDTKLEGLVLNYDEIGILKTLLTFKSDQMEGLIKEFASDQSLLAQYFCRNNQLNGPATRYDKGDLIAEEFFEEGVLDGLCKYYRKDGTLKEEVGFMKGLRHGINKIYDEKGNKIAEYTFTEGVLNEK